MKITLIWLAAIAISLVPLSMLYRGNPRAVPLGFLVAVGPLVFVFGALGIGFSGDQNGHELFTAWVITLVVMAVLAVLNYIWLVRSGTSPEKWIGLGWVAWTIVVMVCWKAAGLAHEEQLAARYEIEKKEMADPSSHYSKVKAMYDRPNPAPVPTLTRVVNAVNEDMASYPIRPARWVYFGDEAKPETVSIWAVMDRDSAEVFGPTAVRTGGYFLRVNLALKGRMEGPVSVGITTEQLIAAAGGDSAYFGAEGSRVVPQFDRSHVVGSPVTDLAPPLRR